MWRKRATPGFLSSLRRLTPSQRWDIQQLAAALEKDPDDKMWNPIILDSNTREIEREGLVLRYRLEERSKDIWFLKAEALV